MKFNDRELVQVAAGKSTMQGVLNYLKPQANDWSDWYAQSSYKERHFKLVSNLLFYYRIGEMEPLGLLVLENIKVQIEKPQQDNVFGFSIVFNDEVDKKHVFSCRCEDDVERWVSALVNSSYEYWRSQLLILKQKINMRLGFDPMIMYSRDLTTAQHLNWKSKKTVVAHKSSFRCHLETTVSSTSICQIDSSRSSDNSNTAENLITF